MYKGIGDENVNLTKCVDVVELIRSETWKRIVTYCNRPENVVIDVFVNDEFSISIEASCFLEIADKLSEEIKNGQSGTFHVSATITEFFNLIEMKSIKAKRLDKCYVFSTVSDDRFFDKRKHVEFFIKSEFGHNPTLFNTAKASAAVYKITGMTDELMENINHLTDNKGHAAVGARCDYLTEHGCSVEFCGFPVAHRADCAAFEENLDLIDPRLPVVIEQILRNHFFEHEAYTNLEDAVNTVIEKNPCNLSRPEVKYPYMIKSFLYASYCGLTASTLWNGKSEVNGGFIKLSGNGDVLAYYALESDSFKSYLYKNCYLEFPSTAEDHGNYAKVYKEDSDYYFRLNFQIRYR